MPDDDQLVSVNRAAALFGKDRRTVSKALRGAKPAGRRGRARLYTFEQIGRALYGTDGDDPDAVDEQEERDLRRRKLRVDVLTAEVDYAERIGGLTSVEGVQRQAVKEARRVRDRMLKIPDKLAPELAIEEDQHTVRNRLEAEVRIALEGLAESDGG